MDLTVELLLDFFEQARKYVKKRLPERRVAGRLAMSSAVRILPADGKSPAELMECTMCNLSTSGIALIVPKSLTVGQEFCIRLVSKESLSRWIRCSVTRWQATATGSKQIGAKFCDLVCTDSGEIPMLIDPTGVESAGPQELASLYKTLLGADTREECADEKRGVKASGEEQRKSKRVPVPYDSMVTVMAGDNHATQLAIHIRDISTSGVGFMSASPVPENCLVAFVLRFSNLKAKAILARVVHCVPLGNDQYKIGAELVESIAQNPASKTFPLRWRVSPAVAGVA